MRKKEEYRKRLEENNDLLQKALSALNEENQEKLNKLNYTQKLILALRFGLLSTERMSLEQITDVMGLRHERVKQVYEIALKRIRSKNISRSHKPL